jgi:hypothetical protein
MGTASPGFRQRPVRASSIPGSSLTVSSERVAHLRVATRPCNDGAFQGSHVRRPRSKPQRLVSQRASGAELETALGDPVLEFRLPSVLGGDAIHDGELDGHSGIIDEHRRSGLRSWSVPPPAACVDRNGLLEPVRNRLAPKAREDPLVRSCEVVADASNDHGDAAPVTFADSHDGFEALLLLREVVDTRGRTAHR